MAEHNDLGEKGEIIARNYLLEKGYSIKHVNWVSECNRNELDIVAEYNGELVVVEVKSRSSVNFEHPKDAITTKKIQRIVKATNEYILDFDIQLDTRFDVISVLKKVDVGYIIEHIENAFYAPIN